jgi:hypothetical protein
MPHTPSALSPKVDQRITPGRFGRRGFDLDRKEVHRMLKAHLRYVRYALTALSAIGFAAAANSQ